MKIFLELNTNLSANHITNVKTLRYAAGDKMGKIEMFPTVEGNEGSTSIGKGGDKAKLVTIDSFHLKNISFIKIDAERFEKNVLAGAKQTIKNNRPVILCEIFGGTSLEKASPAIKIKINSTINFIKAMGYKVKRVSESDYLAVPVETKDGFG